MLYTSGSGQIYQGLHCGSLIIMSHWWKCGKSTSIYPPGQTAHSYQCV